ncbi:MULTISPECIES: 2-hydroxyacid dehydrogenase [unclassified Caballeronia]|uniref:2-hydroxyacid dehydrogenase n=1 Tax=unclassified Caballeronia TaxID=2646786 RepID=UPI0028666BEB|nr:MULTISPECIES: 2-hydroxyacid dehydrogenase [unclassified Caballeronia]MDR5749196.1 2-hydroxyacid dehydrogenase [Caballeronia sp. LZ024]MDR5843672.1 2-hydroxyacid dehydrogenase [Caballeronia sp. LZ031]
MPPTLLVLIPLVVENRASISAAFDLVDASDPASRDHAIATHGERIRAVLTNGTTGIAASDIERLPNLELIGALGAGYENIARDAAKARGIVVVNGAGTNDSCVADHAFALLLAAVRAIPVLDRACRDGIWREQLPMQPNFSGKRLGVVGLGAIGRKVARRASGFELEIGYHNRRPQPDVPYAYFDSLMALAGWADYLVVTTPGGAATQHLIDADVLEALGPQGYLVNVSRGSVVDTAALADALAHGAIAGAGLDVYEGEPAPPARLTGSARVVLTPHVGGRSPEALAASAALFVENATRHFAGQPVLTPV